MIAGKVVGNVVCTQKDASLVGIKMLIVQPINLRTLEDAGSPFVALDCVGAGVEELVIVVGGSSARMADSFAKVPVDRSIVGIVDLIQFHDKTVFSKSG